MSDSELGRKLDRCLADTVVKIGTGFGLGLVFSLTFFKRRMWPLAFGSAWDWEWPTPTVSMISRLRIFYMENMSKWIFNNADKMKNIALASRGKKLAHSLKTEQKQ